MLSYLKKKWNQAPLSVYVSYHLYKISLMFMVEKHFYKSTKFFHFHDPMLQMFFFLPLYIKLSNQYSSSFTDISLLTESLDWRIYSCMCSNVPSNWLPNFIKITQVVLMIFKMTIFWTDFTYILGVGSIFLENKLYM